MESPVVADQAEGLTVPLAIGTERLDERDDFQNQAIIRFVGKGDSLRGTEHNAGGFNAPGHGELLGLDDVETSASNTASRV